MTRYIITEQINSDFLLDFQFLNEFGYQENGIWYVEEFTLAQIDKEENKPMTVDQYCQHKYNKSKVELLTVDQKRKDLIRFKRRASVKDDIISEMAAENMERVRNGLWTVQELVGLTSDPNLKQILDDINTLSYEIAYSRIDSLDNSILTQDIKDGWKNKLAAHFYL